MGLFNFFGESDHKVFDYKPIYYDKDKEELKAKFSKVDGSADSSKGVYAPGSHLQGAFRDGNYSKTRTSANKAQNIIGLVGLILIAAVLFFIAKFYTLL